MRGLRPIVALLALLTGACGGATGTPAKSATIAYQVDGMHCDGCAQAITDKVMHLDGVTACRVSLENRRADVEIRGVDRAPAVRKAIETLGYKVTPLDGAPAAPPAH